MPVEIRAYHCDGYGHVNNARWVELLDEGRWQFWNTKDRAWFDERGLFFIVSRIEVDYLRPAAIGDQLELHAEWVELGDKVATLKQTIRNQRGKECVRAVVTMPIMDKASGRTVKIEGELLAKLQA